MFALQTFFKFLLFHDYVQGLSVLYWLYLEV